MVTYFTPIPYTFSLCPSKKNVSQIWKWCDYTIMTFWIPVCRINSSQENFLEWLIVCSDFLFRVSGIHDYNFFNSCCFHSGFQLIPLFCALFVLNVSCIISYLKSLFLAHISNIAMSFYIYVHLWIYHILIILPLLSSVVLRLKEHISLEPYHLEWVQSLLKGWIILQLRVTPLPQSSMLWILHKVSCSSRGTLHLSLWHALDRCSLSIWWMNEWLYFHGVLNKWV